MSHVIRFQIMALQTAHSTTASAWGPVSPFSLTMPPRVSATAVPPSTGPSKVNTDTSDAACAGVNAREATSDASMFDAS